MELKISIVTCSDTRDLAQDEAGAALEELIEAQGWTVASHMVVRDDVSEIGDAIVEAADECHANVVLTCGGTGLSMRDVTPEATRAVCDRDVPGIAEAIRAYSMTKTRRAMLSRAICMQRRSYTCRKLSRFYEGRPRKLGGHEQTSWSMRPK